MKNIYSKIALAKKEIGAISKDTTNDFFKAKYFDINKLLQHVEPILEKHDLMVLQPIVNGCVQTVIIDCESGVEISSEIKLPELDNPQKLGSAITYYRRYTLTSLLSLQAEDDDGNSASKPTPAKKKFAKVDADAEFLKGTPAEELSKKYIITPEQITKYKQLTKTK